VSRPEHAAGRPAVICENPLLALGRILERLFPVSAAVPAISDRAVVSPEAKVGKDVSIGPGSFVERGVELADRVSLGPNVFVGEGARLGPDTVVMTGAVIEHGTVVGARCRIFPGAVVGSDGFGYVWDGQRHRKIPQVGIVVLEDEVEIGANACIDRATLRETRIGRGTKIDNLVQIGHNVTVGEHSLICGLAGIAGSVKIGKRVTLAGQAGIADWIEIGDGATVTAQAGVMRTVEPGSVVSGMPAEPHQEFLKREAAADQLPEALERLARLEAELASRRGKE
jgi:UDP-3-O-[3-hydroxymyristoyl] glucosamine N-acyltransferase